MGLFDVLILLLKCFLCGVISLGVIVGAISRLTESLRMFYSFPTTPRPSVVVRKYTTALTFRPCTCTTCITTKCHASETKTTGLACTKKTHQAPLKYRTKILSSTKKESSSIHKTGFDSAIMILSSMSNTWNTFWHKHWGPSCLHNSRGWCWASSRLPGEPQCRVDVYTSLIPNWQPRILPLLKTFLEVCSRLIVHRKRSTWSSVSSTSFSSWGEGVWVGRQFWWNQALISFIQWNLFSLDVCFSLYPSKWTTEKDKCRGKYISSDI